MFVAFAEFFKRLFKIQILKFSGEHEADTEGDPEGDGRQHDLEAAPDHRHDDDDGPAIVRHQLRKSNFLSPISGGRFYNDFWQENF